MKKVIFVIICLSFMVCSNVYGVKQELKGVKIVLDAGHGGFDNGTMDYGYKEDDINLEIILKLKEVLKKEGAKVYLTRDGDYDMTKRNHHYSKQDDMYLRVKKIDRFKADYLISIHQNASGNKSAWGSQVFYYYRSTKGNELAKDINQSLKEVTHSSKPVSGCGFRVLRATKTLGVLIECGFMSNWNECGQLRNKAYQEKICIKIKEGLVRYHQKVLRSKKKEVKKVLE